ncbi:3-dehydroquinate synthase [Gorillibacterium massiliense]|uniref:3-dehydroquinate synthase n=1 Tax=Gorillibacterium massiliense TaxID=1280390 RepID=UPI0004BB7EBA|nr:3-dehydroquinate synthase [Gorillibacterium massiliense]
MKELKVDLGERSYPIYIGSGILAEIAEKLAENGVRQSSPHLIITDDHVAKHHLERVMGIMQAGGFAVSSFIIPSGESSKSLTMLEEIVGVALQAGLERSSAIIALGGGVVGDLAGFAAASYMRGIRFVQIPTTILAHDSSVGGKVAVNHKLAKNVIGAFYQPEFVLYDTELLQTLPDRDVRSGFSEVIKHGLIWDEEFAYWCEDHVQELLALNPAALEYALFTGVQVKTIVVSQDEKENGLRAILNLGHTIGHALEAVAGYNELLHGEAISIGMVGSAKLAVGLGRSPEIEAVTERIFRKFGLPVRIPAHLDTDQIMAAMMHDKKFRENRMSFVLPLSIGKVEINNELSVNQVRAVVEELKREG